MKIGSYGERARQNYDYLEGTQIHMVMKEGNRKNGDDNG